MAERINVGDRVDKVMVVAKKVARDYSGGRFLLLQFSDSEGLYKGVYWGVPPVIEETVMTNDIVRVKGDVQEYQGALQIKVNSLEKLSSEEFDPTLFIPSSSRDMSVIYEEILTAIGKVENSYIKDLLEAVFGDDSFRERFLKAPAAKGWHHSYVGGLAEHLFDMLKIALAVAEVYPEVDRDLLVAGVLLHDLGKLAELSVTNHIDYTDRGRLLGHISIGVEFLDEYLRGMEEFPVELELRLKHMILSHHGRLEHGSPVLPMTIEALLLGYIDNLDAQVRGSLMAMGRGGGEGNWTDYVKLLDRFLYRGGKDTGDEGEGDESG
ncbi:MAG: HD domain-containing protein [Candidatus Krumholzibacteria bacterium]|nr:HD domain-containing protein [Candidatus Krumholzibacteria bacterium]